MILSKDTQLTAEQLSPNLWQKQLQDTQDNWDFQDTQETLGTAPGAAQTTSMANIAETLGTAPLAAQIVRTANHNRDSRSSPSS